MEDRLLEGRTLTRESIFSYTCDACGRCCHDKRIQTSPYEVLRLARNLELSTGEFLIRFIDSEGPYLRAVENGACVFLDGKGCRVHEDRPLACRTYPLGLYVSPEGVETFLELKSHPQTEGVYGRDGTVDQFLEQQGVQPYLDAARQYMALFYRLYEALHRLSPADQDAAGKAEAAILDTDVSGGPAFQKWFDVDRAVAEFCRNKRLKVPVGSGELVKMHVMAVEHWLETLTGEASHEEAE